MNKQIMFVTSAILRRNNFNTPNNPIYFKLLIKFHSAAYYFFLGMIQPVLLSYLNYIFKYRSTKDFRSCVVCSSVRT